MRSLFLGPLDVLSSPWRKPVQVESFLESSARQRPDKTALVCGDARLTYADLEQSCNRSAHALVAEGIERGDRVAVYLENSVEAVIAVFAILKAGAVFMMVNPTTKADKLAYVLNNSRARALILPGRRWPALGPRLAEAPHLRNVILTGSVPEGLIRQRAGDCPVSRVGDCPDFRTGD